MVIHPGNPDEVYPVVGQGDGGTSEDWETDEHALIDAVCCARIAYDVLTELDGYWKNARENIENSRG